MKTLLKILLVGVCVAVLLHFWPLIFAVSGVLALAAAGIVVFGTGGVSLLVGMGLALAGVVVALFALGLALLSPLWIPLLVIVGLIALIRNVSRSPTV